MQVQFFAQSIQCGRTLAIVLIGACGPGGGVAPVLEQELPARYAASICEEIEECNCAVPEWRNAAECVAFFEHLLSEQQLTAKKLGLRYDADCAQAVFVSAKTTPCSDGDAPVCQIYSGDTPQGAECKPIGYSDRIGQCVPSAVCLAGLGLCVDAKVPPPAKSLEMGEQCLDEAGVLVGYCSPFEASYCALDKEEPVCVRRAHVGEMCSVLPVGAGMCEVGAYCDRNNRCALQMADGEMCVAHAGCVSAICIDGVCEQPFVDYCPLASL